MRVRLEKWRKGAAIGRSPEVIKGAPEGWVVGVIHWNGGALKSAGGGLGWPEDRRRDLGNSVVFK